MNIIRMLATFVLILLGVVIALLLITQTFFPQFNWVSHLRLDSFLGEGGYFKIKAVLAGILLLLCSWSSLSMILPERGNRGTLVLKGDQGVTSISAKALEDSLNRALGRLDSVCRMKACLHLKGETEYRVDLREGQILEDRNVSNTESAIREQVRSLLVDKLGLPAPLQINVDIRAFGVKANIPERDEF